ncbi:MAG: hypothetical protein KGJ57_02360 [Sphingomonadales bacterium]|nr:hypothetical protein [Sphingomonadales bacterium]MDE2168254.1 hypothetical protein [Sphingomonadales bacterium]
MRKTISILTLASLAAIAPVQAQAKGCVRGAVAGAVVGHYAGHHAVAGAVGGCIAARAYYKHKAAQQAVQHPAPPPPHH